MAASAQETTHAGAGPACHPTHARVLVTIATATVAATVALWLLLSFVDPNGTSIKVLAIQFSNHVGRIFGLDGNKAEATRAAGVTVRDDFSVQHFGVCRDELGQI